MKALFSLYRFRFARQAIGNLARLEYSALAYLRWLWRTTNFDQEPADKSLINNRTGRIFLGFTQAAILIQMVGGIALAYRGYQQHLVSQTILAAVLALSAPIIWAHLAAVPAVFVRWLIIKPRGLRRSFNASKVLHDHPGARIAVAGKSSRVLKGILSRLLNTDEHVTADPAGQTLTERFDVFCRSLKGDEEILIFDFGDGFGADAAKLVRTFQPNLSVITGFGGDDTSVLEEYLHGDEVYLNSDDVKLKPMAQKPYLAYSAKKAGGWSVSKVTEREEGLKFQMRKKDQTMILNPKNYSRDDIGEIALAVYFAVELGIDTQTIEEAVKSA